jgi:hypothetical protein
MDETLTTLLCDAVVDRLNYLDKLASEGDMRSRAALADTEIMKLTLAWRTVLDAHRPDRRGRCPQCSGWRRPRRHPCSVWATAHELLIVSTAADTRQRSPHDGERIESDRRPT